MSPGLFPGQHTPPLPLPLSITIFSSQISEENQFGCSPCFCNGHSTECHLAPGYVRSKPSEHPAIHFLTELLAAAIKSQFLRGPDDWTAEENGRNIRDRTIFNAYKKIIGKRRKSLKNICDGNICGQDYNLWMLRHTLWLRRNSLVISWPATARS